MKKAEKKLKGKGRGGKGKGKGKGNERMKNRWRKGTKGSGRMNEGKLKKKSLINLDVDSVISHNICDIWGVA